MQWILVVVTLFTPPDERIKKERSQTKRAMSIELWAEVYVCCGSVEAVCCTGRPDSPEMKEVAQ